MSRIVERVKGIFGCCRRAQGALAMFAASALFTPVYSFHGAWDAYSHLNDVVEYSGDLFSNDAGRCPGSPVYGRDGEFFFPEQDVLLAGRPALGVTRTYNSKDPTSGIFGNGWSSSCDVRLIRTAYEEIGDDGGIVSGTRYVLRTADGRRREYDEQNDGTFLTPPGRFDRVTLDEDGTARLVQPTGDYRRFSDRGQLLQHVDRNGNSIDYQYDDAGQLSRMGDAVGRFIDFSYDTSGRVVSLTDHDSRSWEFSYDASGNLVSRTDPLGGERRYEYQAFADPLTGHTSYQLIAITDETGITDVSVVYMEDRVSSYTINENVHSYTYNRDGSTTVTDSTGSRTTYEYSPNGMFSRVNYPDRTSVAYDTDIDGNIVTLTDQEGSQWSYTYRDDGSILSVTDPLLQTTSMEYEEDSPRLTSLTSPLERVTRFTYDGRGNPLTFQDAAGNVTRYEWSDQGDLLAYIDASGERTTYVYNDAGLVISATNPLGHTISYRYDDLGRQTGVTLPEGEDVSVTYDTLDRVVSTTDALGQSTSYAYDGAGRLLQLTDAGGNVTSFTYDGFGRLVSETRPDGNATTYTYAIDNMLASSTDPRGVVTTYSYDANKRLTQIRAGTETSSFRYDRRGNLVAGSGPDGDIVYEYDSLGRAISESVGRRSSSYVYNADSQLIEVATMGEVWRYSYDSRGLTTGFETPSGSHAYAYNEIGQLVEHTRPNGRRVLMAYDSLGQLIAQDDSANGGALYTYEYDSNGRLLTVNGDGTAVWSYSYDSLDRLVTADHEESYAYSYDALGNRLDRGGQYDAFNKLIVDDQYDYTYDSAGNLITRSNRSSGEVMNYEFNARGRLKSVRVTAPGETNSTTIASYGYDIKGRLTYRTVGRETTWYQWAGDLLVGEFDGNSADPSRVYRYGGAGWTATEYSDTSGTYYVQDDYLNTPRYLTNEGGDIVWRNQMTPYGIDRLESDVDGNGVPVTYNQRFPGQFADNVIGLNYNRSRYYNSGTGRYISSDPIGIAGGINTYAYVGNNPTNYLDLNGMFRIPRTPLGDGKYLSGDVELNGFLLTGIPEERDQYSLATAYAQFDLSLMVDLAIENPSACNSTLSVRVNDFRVSNVKFPVFKQKNLIFPWKIRIVMALTGGLLNVPEVRQEVVDSVFKFGSFVADGGIGEMVPDANGRVTLDRFGR